MQHPVYIKKKPAHKKNPDVTILPPLQGISTPRFDLREKIWQTLTETILMFPCRFLIGVVAPLDFAEVAHISSHCPQLLIKNIQWVLFAFGAMLGTNSIVDTILRSGGGPGNSFETNIWVFVDNSKI
jgi:hypothetical protein